MHCANSRSPGTVANAAGRILLTALLTFTCVQPIIAADPSSAEPVQEAHIESALAQLRADPELASTRTIRTLRWIDDEDESTERPSWFKWIGEFFGWIAEGGRVLVWIIIAVLVGLLALYLLRLAKMFAPKPTSAPDAAPTHVRDLDIRPESLPHDIGAAAWTLWERREHRGALSLLYRGLLSRLVHQHAVPIRHSSTEGDCLALAQRHVADEGFSYVARLIRTWQRAVYGGTDPDDDTVRSLCEHFSSALQTRPAREEAAR